MEALYYEELPASMARAMLGADYSDQYTYNLFTDVYTTVVIATHKVTNDTKEFNLNSAPIEKPLEDLISECPKEAVKRKEFPLALFLVLTLCIISATAAFALLHFLFNLPH